MKRTLLTMSLVTSHLQLTLARLLSHTSPLLSDVRVRVVYFSILEMALAMV